MGSNAYWDILVIKGDSDNIMAVSSFILDKSCGLEENNNFIKIYFEPNMQDSINQSIDILSSQFKFTSKWEKQISEDWHLKWEENFTPIFIKDSIVIKPNWDNQEYNAKHNIIIKPGMAFGTGHHETTTLILERLVDIVKPGQSILDLGTGSGILSIAAKKLGASNICALDNDDICCGNFNENMNLNNITDIPFLLSDALTLDNYEYDLIIANINRNVLVELIPKLVSCKGKIILSGLLISDQELMIDICNVHNFSILDINSNSEWISILLESNI